MFVKSNPTTTSSSLFEVDRSFIKAHTFQRLNSRSYSRAFSSFLLPNFEKYKKSYLSLPLHLRNLTYQLLPQVDIKAWSPPMRLTYSHVYFYENKYNLIGGKALNNLKKILSGNFPWDHFLIFIRIISKCFDIILTNSHKIIEIKERPLKHLLLLTSVHWKWVKKQSSVIFELDNVGKKRRDCGNVKIVIHILL